MCDVLCIMLTHELPPAFFLVERLRETTGQSSCSRHGSGTDISCRAWLGNIPHWHRTTKPSFRVEIKIMAPLWVTESLAGYFHLWNILWFLNAFVIVARLRHCWSMCLDRSGSNCSSAYCGCLFSALHDVIKICSLTW